MTADVIFEPGCASGRIVQRGAPVSALTACTMPVMSPKYAAYRAPGVSLSSPTLTAARTCALALYAQYAHPVFASSA